MTNAERLREWLDCEKGQKPNCDHGRGTITEAVEKILAGELTVVSVDRLRSILADLDSLATVTQQRDELLNAAKSCLINLEVASPKDIDFKTGVATHRLKAAISLCEAGKGEWNG